LYLPFIFKNEKNMSATVVPPASDKNINNIIEEHTKQLDDLQNIVNTLSIKLQVTTDLTDDVIGASSSVVSHADNVLTWYLAIFTLLVTGIVTLITLWVGKSRTQHIEEATKKILNDLANDETLRDEFVKKLISHPNMRENINSAIEKVVDDTVKNAMKGKLKEMIDGIGE
jgi:predicted PurR-regulated permease PerM